MENPKPTNRPYILTKTPKPTLLPRDYQNFDERIEKYIRFVQTANSFVSVFNFFFIFLIFMVFFSFFLLLPQCGYR